MGRSPSKNAAPNLAKVDPALRTAFQAYASANPPASPLGEPLLSWSDTGGKGHLYSNGVQNWFWLEGVELRAFVPWQALDGIYRWRFGSPYATGALPASDTSGLQLETKSGLVTWLDSRYLDLKKAEELLRGILGNRWSELYHDTPRLWTTGFDGTAGKHRLVRAQEAERATVPREPGELLLEEPEASVRAREKRARVVSVSLLLGGLAVWAVGASISFIAGLFSSVGYVALLTSLAAGGLFGGVGGLRLYRYRRLSPFRVRANGLQVPPHWGSPIALFIPFEEIMDARRAGSRTMGPCTVFATRLGEQLWVPDSFVGAADALRARMGKETAMPQVQEAP